MRILMVTDFYHPLLGGVEQHVRSLGQELCRTGHEVTVATLAVEGEQADDVDGEVEVIRLPSSTGRVGRLFSQQRSWAPPVPDPEAARGLRRVVDRVRPDVVHGHDWLARSLSPRRRDAPPFVSSLHYYTRTCARKDLLDRGAPCSGPSPRKCVVCAVDHYGPLRGPGVAAATAVGRRLEERAASATIAVSRATATGNGLDPDSPDVHVIPNFLPPTSSEPSGVDDFLDELPTEPFMMYVGDFRAVKGFDLLLEAYERSGTSMPLVAVGKTWPESPASVPPGVVVFEQWPNDAVRQAFGRAAFAVVPSIWDEPFGIVAIEALSAGTPVVAADVGGLGELVVDVDDTRRVAPTGMLFPRGDAAALGDAITRFAGDPALCARLGETAAVDAQRFHADRVVPDIVEVYRSVQG